MDEWRDVVEYEGFYAVSSTGKVKRTLNTTSGKAGRILRYTFNRKGYPVVALSKPGTKKKCCTVHSLVAAAFIGPRPVGLQINHKDGNKSNPSVRNLEYCTQSDNMKHSFAVLGRKPTVVEGVNHPNSKLNDDDIRDIRTWLRQGVSQSEAARRKGVAAVQVNKIVHGKTWTHVKDLV